MNILKRTKYVAIHISKLGLLSTFKYLFQRLYKRKGILIKLKLKNLEHPFFLRNKTYDIHIFYQIFIKEDLMWKYEKSISVIFDCGANIGLSTLYYLQKFPKSRIYSIEPEKNNFSLLLKNVSAYPNVTPLKYGIFDKDCILKVIDNGRGEASFRTMKNQDEGKAIEEISCRDIYSLMTEYKIEKLDILKMDIEGSEKDCLLAPNVEWLKRTRYFLLEIHEDLYPGLTKQIFNKIPSTSVVSKHGEYYVILNKTYLF